MFRTCKSCFKIKVTSITLFCLIVVLSSSQSYAASFATPPLIPRTDWKADETLLPNETPLYVQVKEIKILRLPEITNNATEYMQGLYFYVASTYEEDIPFHYVISGKGELFEGADGGYGVQLQKHVSNGILTIGYIPDSSAPLSTLGQQSLSQLLLYLHTQTGIGLNNINAKGYIFDGTMHDQDPSSDWKNVIEAVKSNLSKDIGKDNQPVPYTVTLSNPQVTKAPDGNNLISVDILNESSQPLYGRIYAGSDKPTPLYFLSHWLSNERTIPQDIENILSGKKVTFNFEIAKSPQNGDFDLSLYTDSDKIDGDSLHISIPKNGSTIIASINPQKPAGK